MKVLILGEKSLDIFTYGHVNRLNPEAPTPILVPDGGSVMNPGMAGNVGEHFRNLKIDYTFVHQQELIEKKRYVDIASNYILLRVDRGDNEITSEPPLIKDLHVEEYDFVVISDYCKGFLTEDYIWRVIEQGKPVFLDTKKLLGDWSWNAWIKINEKEYNYNLKMGAKFNKEKLIVTLGSQGARYKDTIVKPVNADFSIRDVVGAGDTFLTFFSLTYFQTNNVFYAIQEGNRFAGYACQSKGVISDFGKYITPQNS
jgi:bifunctional ADP-heptose synthase (sugar kinase/adenylyltransferase)